MTKEKNNNPRLQSNEPSSPVPEQIRKHAKQKAKAIALPDPGAMTHEEIRQRFYELQVKQTAAELQNQQLRNELEQKNHILSEISEESLRESEERYRLLVESSNDIIWTFDLSSMRYTYCSKSVEIILGYSQEEAKNFKLGDIHPPEIKKKVLSAFEKVFRGESNSGQVVIEAEHRRKEGGLVWMEISAVMHRDNQNRPVSFTGVSRDITERKQAEHKLRESEQKYRFMTEQMNDVVWTSDLEMRITYISPSDERILGFTPEERMEHTLVDMLTPSSQEKAIEVISKEYCLEKTEQADNNRSVSIELEYRHKDGSTRLLETLATGIRDDGGRLIGLHGVSRDITERKKAEDALIRQQRSIKLSNMIANVFLSSARNEVFADVLDVLLKTLDSRFGYFGYIDDAGKLVCPSLTRDVWDQCQVAEKSVVFPRAGWGGLWGRSLMEKQTLIANENLQVPEGHVALENALATPLVYNDNLIGQFVVANKAGGYNKDDRDLLESAAAQTAPILFAIREEARRKTAHKKLEDQMRQAQKMESVGRLAGGVAHDFNNKLSIINGYAELAMESIDPSDPLYKTIQEIHTAGKKSAGIVRQLLAFARRQSITPVLLDLNDTISSMLKMLQRLIGENIDLEWHPGKNLWSVKIDPSQVDQIMANLAVNSRDAISDVGKLTIETDNIVVDEDYCRSNPEAIVGQYVMLAVSDDGCGMDKEIREHLFDPYFTTKEVGKGTGLGLPTVYGIVKQNNGFINLYSEPGEGTTFKLYFPSHKEATSSLYSAKESTVEIPTGTETVLVVEDEKTILHMSKQMLERLGYTVETAGSPAEALQISDEYDGTIDLLITDVIMPEMNGRDLSYQLIQTHPGIKTLYMSGYTANVIAHYGVLDQGVQFIQKPFSLKDLAVKVREVLETDRAIAEY